MIAPHVHQAIQRHGVSATLRRLTATGGTPMMQDAALRAVLRGDASQPLAADLDQSERAAIVAESDLAAAGWPSPPRPDDVLIVAGQLLTVTRCDTRYEHGEAVAHHLRVRG